MVRLTGKEHVARLRTFRLRASFWEAARIALDSLRKNKLRSFLTLLGIILATTTLIAVTALIHGMNLYIAEKVSNMGSDGFRIVRMAFFGNEWSGKVLRFTGIQHIGWRTAERDRPGTRLNGPGNLGGVLENDVAGLCMRHTGNRIERLIQCLLPASIV